MLLALCPSLAVVVGHCSNADYAYNVTERLPYVYCRTCLQGLTLPSTSRSSAELVQSLEEMVSVLLLLLQLAD